MPSDTPTPVVPSDPPTPGALRPAHDCDGGSSEAPDPRAAGNGVHKQARQAEEENGRGEEGREEGRQEKETGVMQDPHLHRRGLRSLEEPEGAEGAEERHAARCAAA